MTREGRTEAFTDVSFPCCVSISSHADHGLKPHDAHTAFQFPFKHHCPGPARVTVVVVDHNRRVLKALGDLLNSAGYDARLFSSGEEFLTSPGIRATRCLISDIGMSGMNGIDLLRQIKAQRMELPCILLTSRDDTDTVLLRRTEGARFLLTKPIAGPELLAAVSLLTNSIRFSPQIGFVDTLRSVVSRAGAFSGWPLVSRACSALFGSEKTLRMVRSRADSNLHVVARPHTVA